MNGSRRFVLAGVLVAGIVGGFWLGAAKDSPVNPNPPRPVLKTLASLIRNGARLALWVAIRGEAAPVTSANGRDLVKSPAVDAEGHLVIDHAEGW